MQDPSSRASWRPEKSASTMLSVTDDKAHDPDEFDETGARLMNKRVVMALLRAASGTYITPEFNSTIYLNSELLSQHISGAGWFSLVNLLLLSL